MNVLNRSFTAREKVLIAILAALLLGLMYFKFVDEPVRGEVNAQRQAQQDAQFDIDLAAAQLMRLQSMKTDMERLDEARTPLAAEVMPSYNYRNEETALINQIFGGTGNFYLGFYDVERDGDQLRRSFTIRFTADNYRQAAAILKELENCGIRCLIGDVSCQLDNGGQAEETAPSIQRAQVSVSAVGTFYETVQGGVTDRELPALPVQAETATE